jgi:hypothetical protein
MKIPKLSPSPLGKLREPKRHPGKSYLLNDEKENPWWWNHLFITMKNVMIMITWYIDWLHWYLVLGLVLVGRRFEPQSDLKPFSAKCINTLLKAMLNANSWSPWKNSNCTWYHLLSILDDVINLRLLISRWFSYYIDSIIIVFMLSSSALQYQ